MTRRLGSTPFGDLLPSSIADDPRILAAAQALDGVLEKSVRSIPNILVFARLANDSKFINPVPMLAPMERLANLAGGLQALSPEILDLLAWQMHVESYDAAVSLQARREMIQASLMLHRKNGTPWSVRHALETLLRIPAYIRQWFEYGGDPYFFRVRLNISGVYVDLRWLLSAFQIVMDYKNVRSWLEWLETYAIIELENRTGIGLRENIFSRQMLFFPYAPMPEEQIRSGLGLSILTKTVFSLYFPKSRPEARISRGLGLGTRTSSKISFRKG